MPTKEPKSAVIYTGAGTRTGAVENRRRCRAGHAELGPLAQHQPATRLPQRHTPSRVRSHLLRYETQRPPTGRNPIARASIRTRAIQSACRSSWRTSGKWPTKPSSRRTSLRGSSPNLLNSSTRSFPRTGRPRPIPSTERMEEVLEKDGIPIVHIPRAEIVQTIVDADDYDARIKVIEERADGRAC